MGRSPLVLILISGEEEVVPALSHSSIKDPHAIQEFQLILLFIPFHSVHLFLRFWLPRCVPTLHTRIG